MRLRRRRLLQALALLPLAAVGRARAHQQRAAISTLLFNARTGRIEVMHRFFRHDAEHALAQIEGAGRDLLESAADRARFADYVHQRFEIVGIGAELEPLILVGAELAGEHLWVYQRTLAVAGVIGLRVRFDALRDIWPDQVNTLNIERGGRVRTLVFASDAAWQRVDL